MKGSLNPHRQLLGKTGKGEVSKDKTQIKRKKQRKLIPQKIDHVTHRESEKRRKMGKKGFWGKVKTTVAFLGVGNPGNKGMRLERGKNFTHGQILKRS